MRVAFRATLAFFFTCALVSLAAADSMRDYVARARQLFAGDVSLLRERAKSGDRDSQMILAAAYIVGAAGLPKDRAQAVPWLEKAGEQGSTVAQLELGAIYAYGNGVPRDEVRAFRWTRMAAEGGKLVAMFNLGDMYAKGEGIPVNQEEATRWMTKSAEGGFSHAQFILGRSYLIGLGVPKDPVQGEKWLRKAVAQGHPAAMDTLAEFLVNAQGVPVDPKEVALLYLTAAQRGMLSAQFNVGKSYEQGTFTPIDLQSAVKWYKESARHGYAPSDFALGRLAQVGKGVGQDFGEAFSHFLRAAELGYSPAILEVTQAYREGRGTAISVVESYFWSSIGARLGVPDSRAAQKELAAQLDASVRRETDRRVADWAAEHPYAMRQIPGEFRYRGGVVVDSEPIPERPPSTEEERARAIALAKQLEEDPFADSANPSREWLDKFWREVPDLVVPACDVLHISNHDFSHARELGAQVEFSGGAFLLQNPSDAQDFPRVLHAGVEGALRAYISMVRQEPALHSELMQQLLKERQGGGFDAHVTRLIAENCH